MCGADELLNKIFQRAEVLEQEYTYSIVQSPSDKWPSSRQVLYGYGPIRGMFEEQDPLLIKYMECGNIDIVQLKKLIIKFKEDTVRQFEQCVAVQTTKRSKDDRYNKLQEYVVQINTAESLEEINQIFSAYDGEILQALSNQPVKNRLIFLKVYILYGKRDKKLTDIAKYNPEQPNLQKLYSTVFEKSSEFRKYGLIPIDEKRTLDAINPARIFDRSFNKTLMICIPVRLAEIFLWLKEKSMIDKMSFRGTDDIYDGHCTKEIVSEELERGCLFNLNLFDDNVNNCNVVTKLYSDHYSDQLWVIKQEDDKCVNLYFEELKDNVNAVDNEQVTSMLHLKIIHKKAKSGKSCHIIEHMDFEYIYYTLDEFEQRKNNPNIKGTATTRKKIFKLDGCCIPFSYYITLTMPDNSNRDVLLLYYVLDIFFDHKDLLNEYFGNFIERNEK